MKIITGTFHGNNPTEAYQPTRNNFELNIPAILSWFLYTVIQWRSIRNLFVRRLVTPMLQSWLKLFLNHSLQFLVTCKVCTWKSGTCMDKVLLFPGYLGCTRKVIIAEQIVFLKFTVKSNSRPSTEICGVLSSIKLNKASLHVKVQEDEFVTISQ